MQTSPSLESTLLLEEQRSVAMICWHIFDNNTTITTRRSWESVFLCFFVLLCSTPDFSVFQDPHEKVHERWSCDDKLALFCSLWSYRVLLAAPYFSDFLYRKATIFQSVFLPSFFFSSMTPLYV